jgi:hypothetical protein
MGLGLELIKWEEHFETLPQHRRTQLYDAIKTIEADPVFYEQYRWTGLFTLAISIQIVENKIEREAKDGKANRKQPEDGSGVQAIVFDKTQDAI